MGTKQDNRLIKINSPLGEDMILVEAMSVSEGMSKLYSIELDLVHAEEDMSYTPTTVPPANILGKPVAISVKQSDGVERFFHGIVNYFQQGIRHVRFTFYKAVVVPHVWMLTQRRQTKIYQQKSVKEILEEILKGFTNRFELQGTYEKRNYCVQYQETDWDFASRLMEEEGIFYFFEHTNNEHKIVIADQPQSNAECPGKSTIPYALKVGSEEELISSVFSLHMDYQLRPGKVTLWDHNFQLPGKKLDVTKPSRFSVGGNDQFEIYDHPGGYARKYDGIDKSGGEQSGDLQKIFTDNQKHASNLIDAIDAGYTTLVGNSDCCSLTPGYRFTLQEHPDSATNGVYLVTETEHQVLQAPSYVSDESPDEAYRNRFKAIPHGAGKPPFRPLPVTPKPRVYGSQTAHVVGPAGEEIFTDKYGRVKVQFHWDRDGKYDANSSCWVRVAQSWAGNKWGMVFIPRVGMEVVVHFVEGDLDQPIITGCVYNPGAMPPYTLPDEKTKSTIKTDSSKGGGGFNELRFEDKKGSEQIFIHAEKNQDIRVKNDCMEYIGNDRHLMVKNDQFEKIDKDIHLTVGGNVNQKIGDTLSINAQSDIHEKAGQNMALDAGMAVHIKAGMTAVIEAGTSLTLKVGGNFININPGGVFISGTMVMINSGGAAGSGGGCNPEAPKDAKEADKADPGAKIPSPPPPPPAPVKSFSPQAIALQRAAQDGTPFCAICAQANS